MTFIPRDDMELAKSAVCEEPEDLFGADAREVFARAASAYLLPRKLTVLEILHSADHQRDMMNAGTSAMQAVQKTASWQVRGMSVPVSERIRRLWDIADAAQKSTAARLEDLSPEPMTKETAASLLTQKVDEEDEAFEFRAYASMALGLRDKKEWQEKIAAVLDFAAAASGPVPQGCVDKLLAELLRTPEAMTATFGEFETAGDAIISLLGLVNETASPPDAPPKAPLGKPLFMALFKASMRETRQVLAAHIVRIVGGPDKMTRKMLADEIAFVVELREALTVDGELVGGDATQQALERRLSRSLSDQTIDMLMQGSKSVGERVMRALKLHKNIFGETAELYLEGYITDLMGQPNVETKLLPEGLSVRQQIKTLGSLHRAMQGSRVAERSRERMANQIEQAQTALLDSTRLLEKLNDGGGSVAERLGRVIELCREGAFIEGDNLDRARSAAQQLMKKPDFLESYLSGAEQKGERAARLKELQRKLAEAKIV